MRLFMGAALVTVAGASRPVVQTDAEAWPISMGVSALSRMEGAGVKATLHSYHHAVKQQDRKPHASLFKAPRRPHVADLQHGSTNGVAEARIEPFLSVLQLGVRTNWLLGPTLNSVVKPAIRSGFIVAYHVALHAPKDPYKERSSIKSVNCRNTPVFHTNRSTGSTFEPLYSIQNLSHSFSLFHRAVSSAGAIPGGFSVFKKVPAFGSATRRYLPRFRDTKSAATQGSLLLHLTLEAVQLATRTCAQCAHWVLKVREDALWACQPQFARDLVLLGAAGGQTQILVRNCQHFGGVSDKAWLVPGGKALHLHATFALGLSKAQVARMRTPTSGRQLVIMNETLFEHMQLQNRYKVCDYNLEGWFARSINATFLQIHPTLAVMDGRIQHHAFCACPRYFQESCGLCAHPSFESSLIHEPSGLQIAQCSLEIPRDPMPGDSLSCSQSGLCKIVGTWVDGPSLLVGVILTLIATLLVCTALLCCACRV